MSDKDTLQIENIEVHLKPLDPKGRGFFPRYQRIISARRAMMEFQKAEPEDIERVYELLMEHMTKPENAFEKRRVLEMITQEEAASMFDAILGANTVPPANGAA